MTCTLLRELIAIVMSHILSHEVMTLEAKIVFRRELAVNKLK